MAITLTDSPQDFSPAYNDHPWIVTSSNTGQPNFKYVFDFYDTAGNQLARRKKSPDPNGYGVCGYSQILRSYLTHDIVIPSASVSINTNSYYPYVLKVGEEYGATPTVYPDLYVAPTMFVFNASLPPLVFHDYDQNDYLLGGGTLFLTNAPSTVNVHLEQCAWLHFMVNSANQVSYYAITTYDAAGNLIDEYDIDNTYSSITDNSQQFLRLPAGPYNINQINPSLITSGQSQPIIDSTVAYYTIVTADSFGNPTSELRRYNIQEECRYEVYFFHFLNVWGGFDSFAFTKASRMNSEIQRSQYTKSVGAVNGGAWNYSKSDRGKQAYHTQRNSRVKVNSDWLTEAESDWLLELVESPQVFIERNNELIAVNITTTSYETKYKNNERLIQFEIEFEYSQPVFRQSY